MNDISKEGTKYMALIKCPECGKEISDKAESCIYCGYPLKENKVIQPVQETKKPLESHVVAYRCSPGSVVAIFIVALVLGIVITTAYIILGIFFGEIMWLSMSVIAALAVLLLFAGIFGLVKVCINASNKHNCIDYDADKCKFILHTLQGKEITIDPSDYVELKDNFNTDNMLIFTYRLPSGKLKKVNLGACADREGLRARINKVIETIEK